VPSSKIIVIEETVVSGGNGRESHGELQGGPAEPYPARATAREHGRWRVTSDEVFTSVACHDVEAWRAGSASANPLGSVAARGFRKS